MSVQRLALVSPYALSVYGGVQEQVLAMSRELSARGRDVLVIAPDAADSTDYDTPATVLRLGKRFSLPANGSKAPLTLSPVASHHASQALETFAPDIVHFHEPFAPLLGWSALWRHDRPAVGTFHRSGDGPALRLTSPLLRRLATKIDIAVAVSEAAASTLRKACGLSSDVLFNGFETERFVVTSRERSFPKTLFFVGRLETRKGVVTAVDAVRAHNARGGSPWRFVIAGDGPERRTLEVLAKSDPNIEFLGRVSDEEKRSWMRRADALIAPSIHGESFGLVLLEGFASETLVIASDIDGYRDAAGGHATLFLAGDAASLENAIDVAIGSESESSIKEARGYAERWSMRRLMDEYEVRYERAHQRFNTVK